jgi:fibronectin-binding autotransporter adhesin
MNKTSAAVRIRNSRAHLFSALRRSLLAVPALAFAMAGNASAANLTWDAGGASPTNPADGSGTWNNSNPNFSNGTTDQADPAGAANVPLTAAVAVGNTTFTVSTANAALLSIGEVTNFGAFPAGATITAINTSTGVVTMSTAATSTNAVGNTGYFAPAPGIIFGNNNGAAGTITVTPAMVYANTLTLNPAGSGNYTFNNNGAGTGTITVGITSNTSANTLVVNSGATFNTYLNVIGGSIDFTASNQTLTLSAGGILGNNIYANSGLATSTLTNATSMTDTINLTGGTFGLDGPGQNVAIGNAGAFGVTGGTSGGIIVSTGATLATGASIGIGENNLMGLITINGGIVTNTGSGFIIGRNNNASGANQTGVARVILNSGTLTTTAGQLNLSGGGLGGTAELDVNGGVFTNNAGNNFLINSTSSAGTSLLNVTGGTSNLLGVTFNNATTGGSGILTIAGGATYIGAGDIINLGTGTSTYTINLNGGTLGTLANWSSFLNMTLGAGTNSTFQGADASGVAHNIFLSGVLSGAGSLTKTGTGVLALSGANTYSGSTTINAGTLQFLNEGTFYNGVINSTTAANVSVASGGTLALSVGGTGEFTTTDIGTITGSAGFANGSALGLDTTDAGGNFALTNSLSGAYGLTKLGTGTLTVSGANTYTGTTTVSSGAVNLTGSLNGSKVLVNGAGALNESSTGSIGGTGTTFTQASTGTSVLSGVNTYTGATTINNSTVDLGGGTSTGSISSSSMLVLGGGTLNYTVTGGGTQTFNGLSLNAGANAVKTVAGDTVALGAITRNAGSTVDFNNAATTGTLTTTTANDAGGILGGYATLNGTDWAANNGSGVITAFTGYETTTAGGTTAANYAGKNVDVTSSVAIGGAIAANTLRFNTNAAETLTLTGVNTLTDGGILVTPNVGSNLSTITGGTLEGSASGNLIVNQNNTSGGLTIASIIANNTGATSLVKSGSGTLTLSGANTYTGATYLNGGVVTLNNASALNTAALSGGIAFDGGTIQYTANSTTDYSSAIKNSTGAISIDLNGKAVTFAAALDASNIGGLTVADTSGLTTGSLTLTKANAFTGNLTIKSGEVNLSSAAGTVAAGTGTIVLGDSAGTGLNATLLISTAGNTYNNALLVAGSGTNTINDSVASAIDYFTGTDTLVNNSTLTLLDSGGGSSSINLSGNIIGTGNIVAQSIGTNGTTNNVLSGTINNVGTITNNGTGAGSLIISGNLGANVTNVIETSTNTTSNLVLTGNNSLYTGTLTNLGGNINISSATAWGNYNIVIDAGTTFINAASASAGTGTITIGNSANTGVAATLDTTPNNNSGNLQLVINNPLVATGSGTDTIDASVGGVTFNGGLTLSSANLFLTEPNANHGMVFNGGVTGTGNITVTGANGNSYFDFLVGDLNYAGTFTNTNAGAAAVTITSNIDSKGTGILQNSATSALILAGNNSTYTGGITVASGTLTIGNYAVGLSSALGASTDTVTLGNSSANATLNFQARGGFGAASGNATIAGNINVNGTGVNVLSATDYNPTYTGSITLGGATTNLTVATLNSSGSSIILAGGIGGTGNIIVSNDYANVGNFVTISTGTLNNAGTITFNNASVNGGTAGTGTGTNTISANIGSALTGIIQNSATNPLLISGTNNNFAGSVTDTLGTIKLGNALALNSNNVVLQNGTTGTATFDINGNGDTIAGLNTANSGATNIVTNSGAAAFLTLGGSGNYSTSATIGGGTTLGLVMAGSGTQTFTGANTYTLGTKFQSGVLDAGSAGALGTTGNLTFLGGTLQYGTGITTDYSARILSSTGAISIDTNGNTVTYASALTNSNTGGLTKLGAGTLTLAATEAYTGTTTVNGGTLQIGNGTAGSIVNSSSSTPIIVGAVGTLAFDQATSTFATNITDNGTVAGNEVASATDTLSGIISGSGGFSQTGTGTTVLTGANTYTGATSITAGTVVATNAGVAGGSSALGQNSAVTMGTTAGTLTLGSNIQIGSLAGGGTGGNVGLSTFTLTDGAKNTNTSYAGVISGIGGLTKIGSGTQVLSGVNTYTGTTTVNAGTLQVGNGTSGSIASTSTLTLGGGTFSVLGKTTGTTNQTIAAFNLTSGTGSTILLNANGGTLTTLTITSTAIPAGGYLNFDYAGTGATNGSTLGNDYVVWSPINVMPGNLIGGGYTVTDAGGSGFATVNGSGDVVRTGNTTSNPLPVSGGSASVNYNVNSSFSTTSTSTPGSLVEALSGSVLANTVTIDTTGLTSGANLALGANTLTLTSGSGGALLFVGANPYAITATGAGGIKSSVSGGALTLDNLNTNTVTINAPILANGASPLAINGSGTTILGGANTYTGATTINGGTVNLTGTLTSATAVGNSATFNINSTGRITSGGVILNNGSIFTEDPSAIISGTSVFNMTNGYTGTVTLASANTYTGATTINGVLNVGIASVTGTSGALGNSSSTTLGNVAGNTLNLNGFDTTIGTLAGGGTSGGVVSLGANTLTINGGGSTFAGIISGTGAVVKTNTTNQAQSFSGANTYSGGTTIKAGILVGQNSSAFGTGSITLGDTSGSNNAQLNINSTINLGNTIYVAAGSTGVLSLDFSSQTDTFSGAITLANNLTILDGGSGNPQTVSGGITGTGNLIVGGLTAGATSTGTGSTITFSTNPINFTGSILNNGPTNNSTVFASAIGSSVTSVTQSSATGVLALTAANTYTGPTTITTGTLTLGGVSTATAAGSISTASTISGNGTFAIDRNNAVTQGVDFSGAALTGGLSFAQLGSGTTTLTAANTYTGTTTVSAGALQLGDGTSDGSVASASTIDNASLIYDTIGNGSYNGVISGTGKVTMIGTGTETLSGANTYTGTTTLAAGTLDAGVNDGTGTGARWVTAVRSPSRVVRCNMVPVSRRITPPASRAVRRRSASIRMARTSPLPALSLLPTWAVSPNSVPAR